MLFRSLDSRRVVDCAKQTLADIRVKRRQARMNGVAFGTMRPRNFAIIGYAGEFPVAAELRFLLF